MKRKWKYFMIMPLTLLMIAGVGSGAVNASRRPIHSRPGVTRISPRTQRELNYAKLTILGPRYSEARHTAGAESLARGHYLSHKSDTDNCGFIWGVLRHTGFKTPRSVYTSESMMRYRGFRHVSRQNARPGDMMVCNEDDPYAAIMLQPWHGKKTMMIAMSGGSMTPNVGVHSYGLFSYGLHAKISHLQFLRPIPVR